MTKFNTWNFGFHPYIIRMCSLLLLKYAAVISLRRIDRLAFVMEAYCVIFVVWAEYTGCPRRNMPDFGRVFLMLNYTDTTQNTYVQS